MTINILEIGFGTGLNTLLTYIEYKKTGCMLYYEAIEPYPLSIDMAESLNYCTQLNRPDIRNIFLQLHQCDWEKDILISPGFVFCKRKRPFPDYSGKIQFNLVYFDAFAPSDQPELWTRAIFSKLYNITAPDGIVVTYSVKGDVRRAFQQSGFKIEKLPGAAGKKEMLRGIKV